MKLRHKILSLFLVALTLSVPCLAINQQDYISTPTGIIGEFPDSHAIDQVVVIKGKQLFSEEGKGAYYYVFSGMSTLYSEAFANIKLPTQFNNANGTRNGYISLGIYGSKHGIDLGLRNTGNGWHPYSNDVIPGANDFRTYEAYGAPSNATNAIIVVKPVNTTTVHMYVQFLNSSGNNVGTPFDQDISVKSGNLTTSSGVISCRYYRFASLVPRDYDNQMDSSYMLGGQFTNLKLYNRNTKRYVDWGISTSTVTDAWKVSPERMGLTYTATSDTFRIDHWSTYKRNQHSK